MPESRSAALLLGVTFDRIDLVKDGLRLLAWLIDHELRGDHFSFAPVGGRGPDGRPPEFDQQPLEATAMLDACIAARSVSGDSRWLEPAVTALEWFLGRNDAAVPLYNETTSAGHDGLTRSGVSENAGAESTISRSGPYREPPSSTGSMEAIRSASLMNAAPTARSATP